MCRVLRVHRSGYYAWLSADLFDYIEMFHNPTRRHSHIGGISPEAFERASNYDL